MRPLRQSRRWRTKGWGRRVGSAPRVWGLILVAGLALATLALLGCSPATSTTSSVSTQTSEQTTAGSAMTSSATTSSVPVPSVSTSSTTPSPAKGTARSVPTQLDLGSADTIKLYEAWTRIGEAGGFDADAASPDALELSYTLSGSLVHLLIVARTDDGKAVTVVWDGAEDLADQHVMATGQVVETVATLLRRPDRVAPFLAAIDEAGPARMMAVFKPDKPGAICDVRPYFRRFEPDTTLPGRPKGYVWEGAALVPLEESDPRFADVRRYVHLDVTAHGPDGGIRDFANFVLPISQGVASTSTETTLAPSPPGACSFLRRRISPRPVSWSTRMATHLARPNSPSISQIQPSAGLSLPS